MKQTWLRLTNIRIFSQVIFFALFLLSIYASWTTRIFGYPVSRLLEMNPLVFLSTLLSTGFVYGFIGWALVIVILTFVFGRVFCNWICPFGTLHQFIGWLFNINKSELQRDKNRYSSLQSLKYTCLVLLLVLSLFGGLQIGLLDPLAILYRSTTTVVAPAWDMLVGNLGGLIPDSIISSRVIEGLSFRPGTSDRIFLGSFWIGLLFIGLLTVNLWYPRFFCRVLCPTGALLGVLSRFSLLRINRDIDKCTDCNLCLTRCEGASDPQTQLRQSECLVCLNCLDDCPEDAIRFSMFKLDKAQVKPNPDFTRRKLLFAAISGVIGFPLLKINGKTSDRAFSPYMIRPPGSVAEKNFLAKCIKCDQCLNTCPTNVLQAASFQEGGFEALWTPVMNFNIGHCQLKCALCSQVCPTGAIRKISIAEKLGRGPFQEQGPVRLGTAFINTSRCLPWANEIPCVVCEEVCPVAPKAIQTRDTETKNVFGKTVVLNKPFIVPDLCIGCGICQKECPVIDQPAVYVTAVGESRSNERKLLLKNRHQDEG